MSFFCPLIERDHLVALAIIRVFTAETGFLFFFVWFFFLPSGYARVNSRVHCLVWDCLLVHRLHTSSLDIQNNQSGEGLEEHRGSGMKADREKPRPPTLADLDFFLFLFVRGGG